MTIRPDKASITVQNLTKEFELQRSGTGQVPLRRMLAGTPLPAQVQKVVALDDVTLRIEEGERVGIIGRNGAGKTTLLSILAGVAQPSSGTLAIQGDVHAMLTIGAVLREELTGRENVRLDRTIHGLSGDEIDARIDAIVEFAELADFIDRPVRTYSSGMKARLAFATAVFVSPDILILDETLSVGDAFFSAKASAKMRSLASGGRIVIIVSHGLQSIVDMCTRCMWLDEGRLVMDGEPALVTAAYEKAVLHGDEVDLAAKFAADDGAGAGSSPETLEGMVFQQSGEVLYAKARAFAPMSITLRGTLPPEVADAGLGVSLAIRRVDGRLITLQRFPGAIALAGDTRAFTIQVDLDPLILGADLYRFEAMLMQGSERLSMRARVLEVIDEEGQFGGRPLLYLSPDIVAYRLEEPSL